MSKLVYFVSIVVLVFLLLLTLPYLWELLCVIFSPSRTTMLEQLKMYQWSAVGFVAFAIVRKFVKNNILFVETFSHEFTHTVFALFLNRRVYSFHAEEGTGAVFTSGRNQYTLVPIALAPYCFPIFTYFLLAFRWMMDFHGMWIYDILIGVTLCFHVYCFKTQIGSHQSDINQYPLLFSYTYIVTAWVINLCVILPSFFPNMNGHGHVLPIYSYGVWSCVLRLISESWDNLLYLIHLL